jgi:formylglycine-generating enzyme
LNRGLAPWFVAAAAGASGCARPSPVGGLLVTMKVDGTLDGVGLTALDVEVRSQGDGGKKFRDQPYAIGSDPSETQLPATMVIQNDGGPTASVIIDVSVWQGAVPIDAREYRVEKIPTDYFAPFDIVFSAKCTALVRVEGLTAMSACGSGQTCDPATSMCAGNVRVVGADAAASGAPAAEAGDEAGRPPGSMDATVTGDATQGPDASLDSSASCPDGDPACAPPDSSACRVPCSQQGTYCFNGQCVPVPPSCIGLDESQCASDEVPGGSFLRSWDGVAYTDASAPATISGLRIDAYEVTVARFANFVTAVEVGTGLPDAGAGRHTHANGGLGLRVSGDAGPSYETGWDPAWNAGIATTQSAWDSNLSGFANSTWYPPRVAVNATLPINSVTWYEAYAFCIWDGGFLPSEAEWNYAASGGSDQRVYPWGSMDPGTASQYAIYGCYYGGGSGPGSCYGWDNIASFGSAPMGNGRFGQSDLAGSMWEWTLDSYAPYDPSCTDCVALSGTDRVFRGGAFNQTEAYLAAGSREHGDPATRFGAVGFRCARTP